MKLKKNINNNVALCIDNDGKEVIIMGKGVGFQKPPAEVDVNRIERMFYDVDIRYLSLIQSLPEEIIRTSIRIIDYASENINVVYSPNAVFVMADYIDFAIRRSSSINFFQLPLQFRTEYFIPREFWVSKKALDFIEEDCGCKLSPGEATGIALNLLNLKRANKDDGDESDEMIVEECTQIIEDFYHVIIDRESVDYLIYTEYIFYQIKETREPMPNKKVHSTSKMLPCLAKGFPECYECAKKIADYLTSKALYNCTDEELFYLMQQIQIVVEQ